MASVGTSESTPISKTPSAKHWHRTGQIQRYNVKFEPSCSFKEFFEMELPEKVHSSLERLLNMEFDRNTLPCTDKIHSDLATLCLIYQLNMSEATASKCATKILELLDLKTVCECDATFGIIDMVIYSEHPVPFHTTVVEVELGGPYSISKLNIYRAQLAAYMVSIAISNATLLEVRYAKQFKYQNILGILHFGLPPLFYKMTITKSYINSIEHLYAQNSVALNSVIPPLVIKEFFPISEPFSDRELIMKSSRSIIFKCYEYAQKLNKKFTDEKMLLLKEN